MVTPAPMICHGATQEQLKEMIMASVRHRIPRYSAGAEPTAEDMKMGGYRLPEGPDKTGDIGHEATTNNSTINDTNKSRKFMVRTIVDIVVINVVGNYSYDYRL